MLRKLALCFPGRQNNPAVRAVRRVRAWRLPEDVARDGPDVNAHGVTALGDKQRVGSAPRVSLNCPAVAPHEACRFVRDGRHERVALTDKQRTPIDRVERQHDGGALVQSRRKQAPASRFARGRGQAGEVHASSPLVEKTGQSVTVRGRLAQQGPRVAAACRPQRLRARRGTRSCDTAALPRPHDRHGPEAPVRCRDDAVAPCEGWRRSHLAPGVAAFVLHRPVAERSAVQR
mmetsp:Transcript_509/g.1973  ORF Transcript_509/g.1973 Transcript_509/m.1973 type:complete len:232 (+) Transcript_509:2298-2993(+)